MLGIIGFEVLKTLKNDPATKEIPVIIVMGADNDANEERGLELGTIDYITKPFKAPLVKARVRNCSGLISSDR
jgi:DNA-binding response OmpR family regulator